MTLLAIAAERRPCSNRSISPADGPTAANPPHRRAEWWDRQTDRQTDARQFRRRCWAYYASSINGAAAQLLQPSALLPAEDDATGNESVPIQLAQCWFSGLAISNAKILIYFSNKIHGSSFIKQHSKTVMVWNYRNADCSLRERFIVSSIIIFGTLSFPINTFT